MSISVWHRFLGVVTLVLLLGASCRESADRAWEEVLSRCADSDQIANVLFFGFSSNVGPGSIWRETESNGYLAVRPFPEFDGAESIFNRGTPNICEGEARRFTNIGTEVAGKVRSILPASASFSVSDADTIALSTPSWAWDQVYVGVFADYVGQLEADHPFRRDLENDRLVVGRALRLNGYKADLTFANERIADIRAAHPSGIVEGGVTGRWTSDRTLSMSSSEPIYVAVQMYRWNLQDGLSSNFLIEVDLADGAHVVEGRR